MSPEERAAGAAALRELARRLKRAGDTDRTHRNAPEDEARKMRRYVWHDAAAMAEAMAENYPFGSKGPAR